VDDVALAEALVRAAGDAVLRIGGDGVVADAKTSATDIVTAADRAAERAMVALVVRERPGDGVLGEEGAAVAGESRTWVLDALDGTWNFAAGLPAFCCAAALVGADGPLAAAVLEPSGGTLYAAGSGMGARRSDPAGASTPPATAALRTHGPAALADAVIATFAHPAKTDGAGVRDTFGRLVERAGQLRMVGSGTLELAWVADGRLHGWAQPDVYPWDWHPGALLVTEAGGAVATVDAGGTPWQLAAANPALLAELAAAVSGA
jgi:myo-inositol-1(or 4)-monophosphatase